MEGWRSGTGDVELGVKYRFLRDERNGISAAVFPRAILPTSSIATRERARFLLPLWIGKDFADGTSIFGGGGYEFNRGPDSRSFWLAALVVTHEVNKAVSVGGEMTWQQSDSPGGTAQVRAGMGSTVKLSEHSALLLSGGPTWAEHKTGYHFYFALGLLF